MSNGQEWVINSKDQAKALYDRLIERLEHGKKTKLEIKHETRTNLQNNSLHKYCEQVADALNAKGITFEMFFKPGYQVEWTKDVVKYNCWRPIQQAITGNKSTTKPTTKHYIEIYDHLNFKLADHGVHVPWPSLENQRKESQDGQNS